MSESPLERRCSELNRLARRPTIADLSRRPLCPKLRARSFFRTGIIHRAVSIQLSAGQNAKMEQLRATTSLAQIMAGEDKREEARAMLADIYGWFTEGFDTADLKDAETLLDELNE